MTSNLGLWGKTNVGEGVVPVREAEVGDHDAEVVEEGVTQEVPLERSIEEPDVGVLRNYAWRKNNVNINQVLTCRLFGRC